jgi:hypothetical protein
MIRAKSGDEHKFDVNCLLSNFQLLQSHVALQMGMALKASRVSGESLASWTLVMAVGHDPPSLILV